MVQIRLFYRYNESFIGGVLCNSYTSTNFTRIFFIMNFILLESYFR